MLLNNSKKKNDFILIGIILLLGIILAFFSLNSREDGSFITVKLDGNIVDEYSLDKNGKYILNNGTNILVIEDGYAYMSYADCPDKICVNEGKISLVGECITCLPNKIIIEVCNNNEESELFSE